MAVKIPSMLAYTRGNFAPRVHHKIDSPMANPKRTIRTEIGPHAVKRPPPPNTISIDINASSEVEILVNGERVGVSIYLQ